MTNTPDTPRKHGTNGWISNTAFRHMTGIRRICWDCGAGDPPRGSVCPGKQATETPKSLDEELRNRKEPEYGE